MATHSSILAWRISWTHRFVGYSPWGCKELDVTSQLNNKGGAVSLKDCGPRSLPPYLMLTTWDYYECWGEKKFILFPIFRRMSLFPAFSTYMKCDDSNQVSLSSKLWICWECCSLPGLVITKATILLCTIAITWPIEGPWLLGALSTYMSWCRRVLPTWYSCPWACPKLHIESGICSRYLLPLLWALCLSLWSIVFLFDVLSFVLLLFVWFFPCVYLPLDFWSTPSYDLVLKADRHTHTHTRTHTRAHTHTQGICQKRRGWCRGEGGKNEQGKGFELSCCLRPWATFSLKSSVTMAPPPAHNPLYLQVSWEPLVTSASLYSYLHTDVSVFSRWAAGLGEFSIFKKQIRSSLHSIHHNNF